MTMGLVMKKSRISVVAPRLTRRKPPRTDPARSLLEGKGSARALVLLLAITPVYSATSGQGTAESRLLRESPYSILRPIARSVPWSINVDAPKGLPVSSQRVLDAIRATMARMLVVGSGRFGRSDAGGFGPPFGRLFPRDTMV